MTREQIGQELRAVQDEIDSAYWMFTRTKKGKPPIMTVPEAYARRRALLAALATCAASSRSTKRSRRRR